MIVMKKKQKLILMYKDFEVLSFEVDFTKRRVHVLEKLEHFDKAPFGVVNNDYEDYGLLKFFNRHTIAVQRNDFDKIMKATNCKDEFELAFKGHGLSLSNHYWYRKEDEKLRYDDINFFTNKWDDSFARAVLSEDYEALKTCSLDVPDVVTPGWGVKGWIYDNGPKLYKLGIDKGHSEEAICEVLASKFGNRLFNNGEVLNYELKMISGKYASVSSPLITIDEELISMSSFLPFELNQLYRNKTSNKLLANKFFNELDKLGYQDLKQFFVKVACLRSLCFISDLHFDNLSMIRSMTTNEIRPAPIFDFGGAFGSSKSGREIIAKANKGTLLLIYFLYSDLDPSWDYSWYDSSKLEGVEDEIREFLSKSEFYTPDLINCVIEIYHQQKKMLDDVNS